MLEDNTHQSSASRRGLLKLAGGGAAVALAGCTGEATTNLTMAGSEQNSASFQAAVPWADLVTQHADPAVEINVQTTGGLDANVRGVGRDEFDIGTTTSPNFQSAAAGTQPFEEVHDGFNALYTNMVYPFPVSFAKVDSGIDYIEDLEERSVATGPPGSAAHTYFEIYCAVNEIDFGSMDVRRIGTDDSFRQLREDQIDAVLTGSVNTVLGPTAQEYLQQDEDARLVVPRDPERTERLANAGQYMELGFQEGGVMFDFPLETFEHAHENSAVADQDSYVTVAGTNTLFATPGMNHDVARELTRVAVEYSESLVESTALWAGFHEETDYYATALPVADSEVAPFHPGAVEALEDAGVWNDDLAVADR